MVILLYVRGERTPTRINDMHCKRKKKKLLRKEIVSKKKINNMKSIHGGKMFQLLARLKVIKEYLKL